MHTRAVIKKWLAILLIALTIASIFFNWIGFNMKPFLQASGISEAEFNLATSMLDMYSGVYGAELNAMLAQEGINMDIGMMFRTIKDVFDGITPLELCSIYGRLIKMWDQVKDSPQTIQILGELQQEYLRMGLELDMDKEI